jgi:hypothetical protein
VDHQTFTNRNITHVACKFWNSSNVIEGWQEYICQKIIAAAIPMEKINHCNHKNAIFFYDSKFTPTHKGAKDCVGAKMSFHPLLHCDVGSNSSMI